MARELGVALSTVQRWAVSKHHPPVSVYGELRELLLMQYEEIVRLIRRLDTGP